jgi:hypothetical protein
VNQKKRILVALLILFGLAGIVLAVDALRGAMAATTGEANIAPGDVPIYQDGSLVAALRAGDLNDLATAQFTDKEEGKLQEGWLLRDILAKYLKTTFWNDTFQIIVSSTSQNKSIQLTWAEVKNDNNKVMFDLSGRGTLKLVSQMEKLDTRNEWIQDVDKIEVIEP